MPDTTPELKKKTPPTPLGAVSSGCVFMLGAFFTGIIRRSMFFCTSIWVKMQTNLSGS